MMLQNIEQIDSPEFILIDKDVLNLINPINNMIPNVTSSDEMVLLTKFYNKFNVFEKNSLNVGLVD